MGDESDGRGVEEDVEEMSGASLRDPENRGGAEEEEEGEGKIEESSGAVAIGETADDASVAGTSGC